MENHKNDTYKKNPALFSPSNPPFSPPLFPPLSGQIVEVHNICIHHITKLPFFFISFLPLYIYIFFPQRNKIAGTLFLVRSLFFGNILCGQGFVGQIYIYIHALQRQRQNDFSSTELFNAAHTFFFFGSVIIRPSFFCLYLSLYSQALFFLKSPRGGGGGGVCRSD